MPNSPFELHQQCELSLWPVTAAKAIDQNYSRWFPLMCIVALINYNTVQSFALYITYSWQFSFSFVQVSSRFLYESYSTTYHQ